MRIVIPISQSDKHLLPKQIEVFKRLGGWKSHVATLVPTPACQEDATNALLSLKEAGINADIHGIARDPIGGWPKACNDHFHDTVIVLARLGNTMPWYWMELDSKPLRKGWQDALETGYNASRTPFFGHVRLTSLVHPNLKGSHMVGAGVYPPNFHVIADAEYRFVPKNEPFDVSLRWRVTQSGVTHTKLIEHRHSTTGYTFDGKSLVADSGEIVPLDGVGILHGCKDDSIADLVLSGALDILPPLVQTVSEPAKPSQFIQPPKVSLEAQLLSTGYRTLIKGVWVHPTVPDEEIAAHFSVPATPRPTPPLSDMDRAIMALGQSSTIKPISSVIQHDVQGDPEIGFNLAPHETLVSPTEETSPEQGADNAAPPVHIPSGGGEPQGETDEAPLLAAPSSEPQTGQPLLEKLTILVARTKKPARVGDWAFDLGVTKEELQSLINKNPDSGLKIARAGWVTIP